METITFVLPFPVSCSVNKLYSYANKKVFLSDKAKKYKSDVYYILYNTHKFKDALVSLEIDLHPPDKRKRDLDNILKIVLDALQFSKIIDNDCQITKLCVTKKEIVKNGCLKITVTEI